MKNTVQFYKCAHCGNVIHFVSNAGVAVSCCGQPMVLLTENTTDAVQEKHVPSLERNGNELTVT
ncbi:MAG: desulfoferrodoxin FeS4 iron-binding domain-containing protein, partial [Clostridiales bacterium]|nr:desulfoferrodoxin FeS4 iron-binding domain-containing protein [Clostridiales bacterium]